MGLVSALFPSADDIQHGKLASIGDFITTLAASPPAEIHLTMDDGQQIHDQGYVVLVSNMPHLGIHYLVAAPDAYEDGFLDVMFFAELSKLDLLGVVFQGIEEGLPDDPRLKRYRVRKVEIDTQPPMPIMIDGFNIGEGRVCIEVRKRTLAVMAGQTTPEKPSKQGKSSK